MSDMPGLEPAVVTAIEDYLRSLLAHASAEQMLAAGLPRACGAPWNRRGAAPATAHTPAKTPPHHQGQPTRQRRTSTTRPESVR